MLLAQATFSADLFSHFLWSPLANKANSPPRVDLHGRLEQLLGQHMVHPAEPVQARHVRVRRVHAQAYLEIPPLPFTILDSL